MWHYFILFYSPSVCSVMSDSAAPWTVAHQAPLSMGFSRQEYWSGCHFLLQGIFLTQGSNSHLLCLLCCRQILYHLSHWGSQARILKSVAFPSPGDISNPGIEPRSPVLKVDSLPAETPGKPKNTGVGSLSLLQQIFLTQESNHSLLNCRQILYQLSYQGSSSL